MDLAPLSNVVYLLAGALLVLGVGALLPRPARGPVMWLGGLAAGIIGIGTLLVLAFAASITLWRDHPGATGLGLLVLFGLFTIAVLRSLWVALSHRHPGDDGDDDDGGQTLPRPLPRRPPPPAPRPAGPDWSGFDEVRREWERTPVLSGAPRD